MNKKKLLSLIMSVALIGAIGVGATLAYFTDTESATNVITMGNVDIELEEPGFDKEDGNEDNTIEDITPGEEIVKDPTITAGENSQDAYVRAKIEITGLSEKQEEQLMAGITINEDWVLSEDGYYYYQKILAATQSATLFNTVVIPSEWGNDMADKTFKIIVDAEAIQSDNFEPTKDDAENIIGWYYTDGTAITVENYDAKKAAGTSTPSEPTDE